MINLFGQIRAKVRNIFSIAIFQKRYDDGRLQVKTRSGRVIEQKESFPYGFAAKAKTGKTFVFCQGGDFGGFEITPLTSDNKDILSKLKENDVAIYTTNKGNIKIVSNGGKIFIGNDSKNMCELLIGLIDVIMKGGTSGAPVAHVFDPPTQANLAAYKEQVKLLLEESL